MEDAIINVAKMVSSYAHLPMPQVRYQTPLAKWVWKTVPEERRNDALHGFTCAPCTLRERRGLTATDTEKMTAEEMQDAIEDVQREAKSTGIDMPTVELDDIVVAVCHSPMTDEEALIVSGTCQACGTEINRTLFGFEFDSAVDLGRMLLRDVGRNDPCPCGSGLKFKRCCGSVT